MAGIRGTSADGMSPADQLDAIRRRTQRLVDRQTTIFIDRVAPQLAAGGVRITDWGDLKKNQREELREVFEERVYPVLTPLARRPGPPVPLHLGSLAQPRGSRPRSQDREPAGSRA